MKRLVAVVIFLLGLAGYCGVQEAAPGAAAPPAAAVPVTPAEFFTLARQQSDIHQTGATPFEMKATFTATDAKGQSRSGEYSELWVAKDRWRREVSVGSYRETDACVSGDSYHLATSATFDTAADDVLDNISPSLPDATDAANINRGWTAREKSVNGVPLIEVARMMRFDDRDMPEMTYLFTPQAGYVRVSETLMQASIYDDLHAVLGRLVPYKVTVNFSAKHSITIQVTEFKAAGAPADEAFVVAGASKGKCVVIEGGHRARASAETVQRLTVQKVAPVYPYSAYRNGAEGKVVMLITIGRGGEVRDVRVVSSPRADLAASAVAAVKHYIYKPLLLNGVPVEVDGLITVKFVPSSLIDPEIRP